MRAARRQLVDADIDVRRVPDLLAATGVTIKPVSEVDAELAGALRSLSGGRSLSLEECCCLALAVRNSTPDVPTADRAWASLELSVRVRLIRQSTPTSQDILDIFGDDVPRAGRLPPRT